MVGFFAAVSWCVALMGGWKRLHDDYPATTKPHGPRWRFVTAHLNTAFYKKCLSVVYAPEGLYIKAGFPLLLHPGILIPWSAIKCTTSSKERRNDCIHLSVHTSTGPVDVLLEGPPAVALTRMIQNVRGQNDQ